MNVENRFLTEEIVRATSGILINGDMGIRFRGISTDTRIIKPGYLFWALKGKRFDGHDFWKEAIEKGAKGLVLSRIPTGLKPEELPKTISIILVRDTLSALGDFAAFWRKKLNFHAIAVAGSCGKTTTKEIIHSLISKFYRAEKSKGNYNNLIGLPLSILSFKEGIEVGVLELGTNIPGEIKRLAEIVYPQTSVLTCIAPEHLEGLGDMEGVLKEELSLFEKTDSSGTLVYNFDDTLLREKVKNFSQKKISVGFEEGADLRLFCKEEKDSLKLKVIFSGKEKEFELPYLGKHNLLNLGLAMGACVAAGVEIEKLFSVVDDVKEGLFTRAKIYELSSFFVIDDTYNANPASVKAALEWAASLAKQKEKKLVAILGDMKELGAASSQLHREVGAEAGKFCASAIFIGDFAEEYAEGFKEIGKPWKCFKSVEEFLENFSTLFKEDFSPEGSIFLIKGSRALAMERITRKFLEEYGEGAL